MLPKKNRLKKEKDFKKVLREGKGLKSRSLFLKVLGKSEGATRFGFVVSKKVSNKASDRNKIKRWLRETVRPLLSEIKEPVDGVIIAFPESKNKSFEEINKEVKMLFKRAAL